MDGQAQLGVSGKAANKFLFLADRRPSHCTSVSNWELGKERIPATEVLQVGLEV